MVHNTHFAQFIPPSDIEASAGTWAIAAASNVWSKDRSAADATFTLMVPVIVPSNSVALQGVKLNSIEVMYSIATGACDDVATVKLYKDTFSPTAASGSGTINTATEITGITLDAGHDTAAERKAIDEHRMIITLNTPAYIDNDEGYHVEIAFDAAANSVVKVFGAIANYTLRA
jgi:hypothetical protein